VSVWVRTLIGLLIFAGFAGLLQYLYGWSTLISPWAQLPPAAIIAALVFTFVSYALRAGRVYDFFHADMKGRFGLCLKLTLQHNLLNNLLPARSGELSFPVLMRRYFAIPIGRSMPALVWFRLLDVHALISLALAAGLRFWSGEWWAPLLAVLWLPVPWLLYAAGRRLRLRVRASRTRVQTMIDTVLNAAPRDTRAFWRDWAWTFANWAVKLGAFAWVLTLFLPMSSEAALWGSMGGDLSSILPIHGVAGAGTYEAGVVAALVPFDIAVDSALRAAVNLHIFLLGATLMGGVVSVVIPKYSDAEAVRGGGRS
jgi:uncharacterized membrane protein YbhN (UPF0104 family)